MQQQADLGAIPKKMRHKLLQWKDSSESTNRPGNDEQLQRFYEI